MRLFLSTYVNKVDRKGRVSVPAAFRAVLAEQNSPGVLLFRSFKLDAIEGCTMARIEEMGARLDTLEQFSEEYDMMAALFADARQLSFDSEGRIMLSEDLIAHAGITENAAFVGQGHTFQIWNAETYTARQEAMRNKARAAGLTLPARQAPPARPGGSHE